MKQEVRNLKYNDCRLLIIYLFPHSRLLANYANSKEKNCLTTVMTMVIITTMIVTRIIITSRLFVIVDRLSLSLICYYSHYTVVWLKYIYSFRTRFSHLISLSDKQLFHSYNSFSFFIYNIYSCSEHNETLTQI